MFVGVNVRIKRFGTGESSATKFLPSQKFVWTPARTLLLLQKDFVCSAVRFSRPDTIIRKQQPKKGLLFSICAGRENRTPTKSLENSYSTIKLVPQTLKNASHTISKTPFFYNESVDFFAYPNDHLGLAGKILGNF